MGFYGFIDMPLIKPSRVCKLLDSGLNGIKQLEAKDPTFPKKIKCGDSRQAPIFYDEQEILDWIESKKAARLPSTNGGV